MISHRLMSGCVVDGGSGVWESGEAPGWNLSYSTVVAQFSFIGYLSV